MDDKDARPADETAGADEAVDQSVLWNELDKEEAAAAPAAASVTIEDKEQGSEPDKDSKDKETEAAAASADDKDKAAGGETTPDIWADAKPEQRAAFEAAQIRIANLEHSDASQRGRLSALTKKLEGQSKAPAKGAKDEVAEILGSKDFQTAEKEYPEVMAPVKAVLEKVAAVVKPLAEKVEQNTTKVTAITNERTREEMIEQEKVVLTAHADYPEIRQSDAFAKWFKSAPP